MNEDRSRSDGAPSGQSVAFRVQTCSAEDLERLCALLAAEIVSVFTPTLVVGIATGGAEVARVLAPHLSKNVERCTVQAARPTTPTKRRRWLNWGLGFLPVRVADQLRLLEHRLRILMFSSGRGIKRTVRIPTDARSALQNAHAILVVDDAADTGATLKAVLDEIFALTRAPIRTAVLTTTMPNPVHRPTFAAMTGVLLRFPWSADANR